MSHHSNRIPQELSDAMKSLMGEYPNGRLNAEDSGALAVAFSHENGVVKMEFPKPVAWIGFTPQQAIKIAQTLIQHARKCGSTEPLSFKIGG